MKSKLPPPPPPRTTRPNKLQGQWPPPSSAQKAPPPPPPRPSNQLLLAPLQPISIASTDTTIMLEWTNPNPFACEYSLQYYRAKDILPSWTSLPPILTNTRVLVTNLEPDTAYYFQVKCRKLLDNRTPGPQELSVLFLPQVMHYFTHHPAWSKPSPSSEKLFTMTYDGFRLRDNLARVAQYVAGSMEPYPEEPEKVETAQSIAMRTGGALLSATSLSGLGGAYITMVKSAWRLHKTGFASLLFHADLQKTVLVLLSFLNSTAKQIGLGTRDVVIGCYFALWQAKKERLLRPDLEWEEHAAGNRGVLDSEASVEDVREMAQYISLAAMSYRTQVSQIQWLLRDGALRLIMTNPRAQPFRPSFFVAAADVERCVICVRGTWEINDAVTDGLAEVELAKFGNTHFVHAGMLKAAKWLVEEAGVLHCVNALLLAASERGVSEFKLELCGHSLGGGVAVLAALLLAQAIPATALLPRIDVFALGTPAVVDAGLAEVCKGGEETESVAAGLAFGGARRVCVRNLICRDDLVPRLSLRSARDFCLHLIHTREQWGPLLEEDWDGFVRRASTAWAPKQRATRKASGITPTRVSTTTTAAAAPTNEADEDWLKRNTWDGMASAESVEQRLERSIANALVVPGLILHTFLHNGVQHASLVDHRFAPLRRIGAFQHCVEDHTLESTMLALRGVLFARGRGSGAEAAAHLSPPPRWESMLDHEDDDDEWTVDCRVCAYPVSWLTTSSSEAAEIRASNHCHACGKIVCSACSLTRVALPHIGIVDQVLVCDLCKYRVD